MADRNGRLLLVGTPIGNVGDVSPRVRDTLGAVDVVACEDTRKLRWLLREIGVAMPDHVVVVNEHTEADASAKVVSFLDDGRDVALVSDAGMPGIADPGMVCVERAVAAGHPVVAVAGPSAVILAVAVSGLPSARFVFEGFLPRAGGARRHRLDEVAAEHRTVVVYEAPHRLARLLDELTQRVGVDRRVVLCRELTKTYEEIWRGSLGEAVDHVAAVDPRGEFVVVLEGRPPMAAMSDDEITAAVATAVRSGSSTKDAVTDVATLAGASRNRVYALARQAAQVVPGEPPATISSDVVH